MRQWFYRGGHPNWMARLLNRCSAEVSDRRAPVLKAYLQRAPGARAHVPIDKDAPLAAFAQVAPQLPVFRVVHGYA